MPKFLFEKYYSEINVQVCSASMLFYKSGIACDNRIDYERADRVLLRTFPVFH